MAFRKLFFKRVQGIRDNYLLQEGDIALDESDFKLYRGDGETVGGIVISGAGGGSGIALTDISVTQASASGAGTLAYNSSTGVITYTPPTASGLGAKTSVSEADVTQHQAALSITESQISDLGTYVTASSTTTFTNKSFDADGTGNTITNIDLANLKSDVLDTDLSSVSGADDTIASAKAIKAYVDAEDANIASDTLTFTNKTFDVEGTGNSISNIDVADFKAAAIVTEAEGIGSNDNDTTLPTSAAVKDYVDNNAGSPTQIAQGNSSASISDTGSNGLFAVFIDGNYEMRVDDGGMRLGAASAVKVDTILDEDNMASDNANALATQQSIKAYVDANSGGASSRTTKAGTTGSLADAAQENLDITGFKGYALLKVQTDRAARVRIYTDAASRTADAARAEGTDPAADDGVIAEVITTAAETVLISPGAFGFNNESTPTTTIPCRITNKSGGASTVTVTLHVLQLES